MASKTFSSNYTTLEEIQIDLDSKIAQQGEGDKDEIKSNEEKDSDKESTEESKKEEDNEDDGSNKENTEDISEDDQRQREKDINQSVRPVSQKKTRIDVSTLMQVYTNLLHYPQLTHNKLQHSNSPNTA